MTDTPLTLYTNPMSRGRVVRWMLEEIGCAYEAKIVTYGKEMKSPDYLAINPMGKVPALTHGQAVVTETVAICAYLADAFPKANLAPAIDAAAARAAYLRWMYFIAGPLESAVTVQTLGADTPEDKQGFIGFGTLENTLKTLEGALKNKQFIAGERFSAADLIVCSYLAFYTQMGNIPANPVFDAYIKRHTARPAYIKASGIDDALAEQQKKAG